jgi:hypothetical protein
MSERYEVEMIAPAEDTRWSFKDLDEAAIFFYKQIAAAYEEDPSVEVALHDLVAGKTLASFYYQPNDEFGKINYDVN